MALAETAKPHLHDTGQAVWLDRLESEHDNLRVALESSVQHKDSSAGLRLVAALGRFWEMRGHLTEGRAWASDVLAIPETPDQGPMRAKALNEAGTLAFRQADYAPARTLYEESLTIRPRS